MIAFDPLYHLVGAQWTHTPTAYGPLFTALSYPLAGLDIAANVFAYKAIAALSCVAIVVLVWHAARLRGMDPVKAVALVGLNPVIVVYGVGGGHNDLLMLAILVAGDLRAAASARRHRRGDDRRRHGDQAHRGAAAAVRRQPPAPAGGWPAPGAPESSAAPPWPRPCSGASAW